MVDGHNDVVRERRVEFRPVVRLVGCRVAPVSRDGEVEEGQKRFGKGRFELIVGSVWEEGGEAADVIREGNFVNAERSLWMRL